jgi:TetR/AcrR family transcriptional repressor of nem operon
MPLSEKAQATRTRILEAANDLFYLHGYNATGLDKVIQAAGVTKGNFYYHFKSKEALAEATLDLHFEIRSKEMEKKVLELKASPFERLMALLNLISSLQKQQYKDDQIRGCYFGNFTLELSADSHLIQTKIKKVFKQYLQLIESLLEKAISSGDVRQDIEAADMASIILSQMEGAILLDKANQKPGTTDHSIQFIRSYLLDK